MREERQAVLADHFHFRATYRQAGGDGLHEHILRAIQRALDEEPEVGHQQETEVFALGRLDLVFALAVARISVPRFAFTVLGVRFRLGLFLLGRAAIEFRVVALHAQQEDAALVGTILGQVIAQVQRLVMHLALLQSRQRHLSFEAFGEIVHADAAVELRLVEIALRLRHQVLQLPRQEAAHFHLHARNVAHHDGDFLFTGKRQQRALAHDVELRRERRHLHHLLHALGQRIAPEGFQPALDLHVEVAADRGLVAEHVGFAVLALAGDVLDVEFLRFLQDVFGDLVFAAPAIRRAALFLFRFRMVQWQQPGRRRPFDVFFQGAGGERGGDDLLRLILGRHRDIDVELRDIEAGQARHPHRLREFILEGRAGARGREAFRHLEVDRRIFLRRGEVFRVDVGVELQLVVAHGELGALAARAPDAVRLTGQLQLDPLFQFGRIDRVGEIQVIHGFLGTGVGRVLVKLST